MALSSLDERDLLLPLSAGIREQPLWDTFLARLRQQTGATWACLIAHLAPAANLPPVIRIAAERTRLPGPDLAGLDLIEPNAMRSGRVYALDEILDYSAPGTADRQRVLLKDAGIADARFIRIASPAAHVAWMALLSDRRALAASDAALLSALAPHFAIALDTLAELRAADLRRTIAEQALALLGIAQVALASDGRVMHADELARRVIGAEPGTRLISAPGPARELAEACTMLAEASPAARCVVRIDARREFDLLLRPMPAGSGAAIAAIGTLRLPQSRQTGARPEILADLLGLSRREAMLAHAMSRGASILEAGAALRLTPETARNYSKRAYAKTGTSGQADLVRKVLTGLAPLA